MLTELFFRSNVGNAHYQRAELLEIDAEDKDDFYIEYLLCRDLRKSGFKSPAFCREEVRVIMVS